MTEKFQNTKTIIQILFPVSGIQHTHTQQSAGIVDVPHIHTSRRALETIVSLFVCALLPLLLLLLLLAMMMTMMYNVIVL